jgi:hypothetical protein
MNTCKRTPITAHLNINILLCFYSLAAPLFIFLLFFGISLNSGTQTPDRVTKEQQIAEIALDELKPRCSEKDNRGAIFYKTASDQVIIAWFNYKHDDKYITVNYFKSPKKKLYANIRDFIRYREPPFEQFLEEAVRSKKFPDTRKAKQLKMPLPTGLLNKTLLDVIYTDKRLNTTKDGWIQISEKECYPYYWNFKPGEPPKYDSNYMINPMGEIVLEIMEPIINRIIKQETQENERY